MRHGVAGRRFSRPTSHREAMLANMVTSLLRHERIRTTVPRAKEARKLAERMITLGKKGSLHARRNASRVVRDSEVLAKVFEGLASRYAARPGGYTRITKLGRRLGDSAEMALLELVDRGVTAEPAPEVEEPKAEKKPARKTATKTAAKTATRGKKKSEA
jgi:large subunit ribosomal protein L17